MAVIHLITKVNAPIDKVFDLARSIDFHLLSANHTQEKAVSGTISGLINLGESVAFTGRHFGIALRHQSKITAMDYPVYFVDEMEKGHFKSFRHEHFFTGDHSRTVMIDELTYDTPYGFLGTWFDKLLLKRHLTDFLEKRNQKLKESVEKQHQAQP